jgi:hypothetical protein
MPGKFIFSQVKYIVSPNKIKTMANAIQHTNKKPPLSSYSLGISISFKKEQKV